MTPKPTRTAKAPITTDEALAQLEALGDPKVRARNSHQGAGERQFGVPMGEIRKVAKQVKAGGHELARALWKTGNADARLLATLLLDAKALPAKELDRMVREAKFTQLAEWLGSYVVKQHPDKEALRQRWMEDADPMAARAGWGLTAERVVREPKGLDFDALLDRIEREMPRAPAAAQWTMNGCLAQIGIQSPKHRARALAIGERLGIYRDYPVSKGCTSPFAPIWIREMVRRQG